MTAIMILNKKKIKKEGNGSHPRFYDLKIQEAGVIQQKL